MDFKLHSEPYAQYSKNKIQTVRINKTISLERDITKGVSKVSMDGPLPIELFTNNLVHFNLYSLLGNNIGDNDLVVTGKERNTKNLCYYQAEDSK